MVDMDDLKVPIIFNRRPSSLPGNLRPEWRLSLLLLILRKCRQSKASLTKMHVLNWSIRTLEMRQEFIALINGVISPDNILIRYEPVLNRVIDLAIGEKLINIVSGNRIQLSHKGLALADEINGDKDCLKAEKEFLDLISSSVTEGKLQELIKAVVHI